MPDTAYERAVDARRATYNVEELAKLDESVLEQRMAAVMGRVEERIARCQDEERDMNSSEQWLSYEDKAEASAYQDALRLKDRDAGEIERRQAQQQRNDDVQREITRMRNVGREVEERVLPPLLPGGDQERALHHAVIERRPFRLETEIETRAAITTTLSGSTRGELGVSNPQPRRVADVGRIPVDTVEWGGKVTFPIFGAGTVPGATAESAAKPEYAAITPGEVTPQTIAVWTDLSNQSLSLTSFREKLRNKLARLVALGENNILRAKVAGTAGVVTQTFVAGDQSVQILRSAAIIEAAVNVAPNLLLFNPADTVTIFGTAVSNAAPQEVAELSVQLFGMVAMPLDSQTAGFVTMGAWSVGSRVVVGMRPTYLTDPYTQMKNNITTIQLEEALDLAVEEPTAFRIVDIVTP